MMAAVDAKGNFIFKNSPTGELFILIGSGNAGDHAADDLYISEIRLGDVDALADGLLLDGNPSQPLEITLKANGGTLEASVNDEKGAALFPGSVLLVPDAPKQQQMALYGDCRTDLKGHCRISGITPGEYHAFGVASENVPIDQRGPEALKTYEKQGIAVKFAEGQKQKVELLSVVVE